MAEEKVRAIAPQPGNPIAATEMFPGSDTVTMVFPRAVILTLEGHRQVHFKEGPQEVPVHLADHWYLKANKAKPYEPTMPPAKPAATPNVENEDADDAEFEDSTASEVSREEEIVDVQATPVRNLRRKRG